MKEIHITDFSGGVIQNADIEDIPLNAQVILQNLRVVNGKLVKVNGMGVKLDAEFSVGTGHMTGMVTMLQGNLASPPASGTGFAYIIAYVTADNKLRLSVWNGSTGEWVDIGTGYTATDLSSTHYYQKKEWNPVVQIDRVLRFIPGADAKPDGTNHAVECWLGRIERVFFDGLYSPTATLYSYSGALAPPTLSWTISQMQGGTFNERGARIPITNMADNDITIVGDHTDAIQPGDYVLVDDNTVAANNGYYLATAVALVSGNTVITFNPAVKDVSDTGADNGWLELPSAGQKLYYKFSYLYDGIQESLLSEPVSISMDRATGMFPRLQFSFDRTAWNKRITGMNVYRSDTRNGLYRKVTAIDFLRKAGKVLGTANTGAYTGLSTIYIPDLRSYNFDSGTTYKIWLRNQKSGTWVSISFTGMSGTNKDVFSSTTRGVYFIGEDHWDVPWRLTTSGGTVILSGTSGAFAGEQTVIVDTDTGEFDAAGGVFYLEAQLSANKGTTTAAATHSSGERTKITTATYHGFSPGDLVELYGFTDASGYNGIHRVVGVVDTTNIVIDAKFSEDLTGYWRAAGSERVILNNYRKAVHVAAPGYKNSIYSEGWLMLKGVDGVYYPTISGDTITYRLYDPGFNEGAEHPLAGEVSIRVTGKFARVIGGRLWTLDPVLDLGNKNEVRPGWLNYSELYQYDVRPVSNIERLDDRDDGESTGIDELDGAVVVAKKRGLRLIQTKLYPAEPQRWTRTHNTNGLGNRAPRGMIAVDGMLYVCHSDGIYRVAPNNIADSDQTPLERMRISEPIGNIYNAQTLAQKARMIACFNEHRREIMWTFVYTVNGADCYKTWAFNIDSDRWREIETSLEVSAMTIDEEGYPLAFDDQTTKIFSPSQSDDDAQSSLRLKRIPLDDEWPKIVRYVTVTYKCARPIQLQIFVEGNATPVLTVDLPAQESALPYRVPIKTRARRLDVALTEKYEGFLLAEPIEEEETESFLIAELEGGTTPNTEIHKVSIYHD